MFPLNDTEPNRYGSNLPAMTWSIILVNLGVLLWEFFSPLSWKQILYVYGSVPLLIMTQTGGGALASLTSTFMHGGWWHLVGNMYALWVFGRRVEDACGSWRFLAFYLACGFGADILSTLIRFNSPIPSLGASGAVYGVMGAYLLLFPGSRIRTFILLGFIPIFPKIRAVLIIFYFLIVQTLIPAFMDLFFSPGGGVNNWAHVGGFFSCFLVFLFLRREAFARYCNEAPV